MALQLREITGPWDKRKIVRPNLIVWNFQDSQYVRSPIVRPGSGTRFSIVKTFQFLARRSGGKVFTNFKVERGAYPYANMKLWYVVVPGSQDDDETKYKLQDAYEPDTFPADQAVAGAAPIIDGLTGNEVQLQGSGVAFETAYYTQHGFLGSMLRMCIGITSSFAETGRAVTGPTVYFSYQEL